MVPKLIIINRNSIWYKDACTNYRYLATATCQLANSLQGFFALLCFALLCFAVVEILDLFSSGGKGPDQSQCPAPEPVPYTASSKYSLQEAVLYSILFKAVLRRAKQRELNRQVLQKGIQPNRIQSSTPCNYQNKLYVDYRRGVFPGAEHAVAVSVYQVLTEQKRRAW